MGGSHSQVVEGFQVRILVLTPATAKGETSHVGYAKRPLDGYQKKLAVAVACFYTIQHTYTYSKPMLCLGVMVGGTVTIRI